MDLLTNRAIDLTKLALDGLMMRQKAISANMANVMTPNYQRKEVDFEGQLKEIIQKDDLKKSIKLQNSANMQYNPTSLDAASGFAQNNNKLTIQEARYLQSNIYDKFNPQVTDDTTVGDEQTGNNVNLEKEVMDMTKVGTKYSILATLEQREFKILNDVIKGQ